MDAAAITLLLLLVGFLSGGRVVAAASDCDDSANFPVRGVANQLAAAAACTSNTHLSGGGCDAPQFATQLVKFCMLGMDAPGIVCCSAVLLTVDTDTGCMCRVSDAFEFILSDLSVSQLWDWYQACGGKRRSIPEDKHRCESASAPPPPEAPSAWPVTFWVAVGLLCFAAVATAAFVALKVWLPRDVQVAVPLPAECHPAKFSLGAEEATTGTPVTGLPAPEDGRLLLGEEAALKVSASREEEADEEEQASPPASVEERSQVARPRLPPTPPFDPLPPAVVPPTLPPAVFPPLARPPPGISAY